MESSIENSFTLITSPNKNDNIIINKDSTYSINNTSDNESNHNSNLSGSTKSSYSNKSKVPKRFTRVSDQTITHYNEESNRNSVKQIRKVDLMLKEAKIQALQTQLDKILKDNYEKEDKMRNLYKQIDQLQTDNIEVEVEKVEAELDREKTFNKNRQLQNERLNLIEKLDQYEKLYKQRENELLTRIDQEKKEKEVFQSKAKNLEQKIVPSEIDASLQKFKKKFKEHNKLSSSNTSLSESIELKSKPKRKLTKRTNFQKSKKFSKSLPNVNDAPTFWGKFFKTAATVALGALFVGVENDSFSENLRIFNENFSRTQKSKKSIDYRRVATTIGLHEMDRKRKIKKKYKSTRFAEV